MNKKISKIILIILLFTAFQNRVNASSLSIKASNTNLTVGSSVVITVKASSLAGTFSIKSSNSSVLSGGESKTWIENGSVTYVFKAKKEGKATVTVSSLDVSDFDTASAYKGSKSITITVKNPVNYSKNNYLKSLSIEGIDFNFQKDKDSYSVNLKKGTTQIKINGEVDDKKASVNGLGTKDVTEGDNYFEIKVTAENGSTRTYKINAMLEEANPIDVKINGKQYRIVKKADLIKVPEGYKEQKIKINDIEVPAFTNEKNKLTLVGLKDEDDIILAIYKDNKYEIYKELSIGNLKLLVLLFPKDKIKSNYIKDEITYDDQIIEAYRDPKETGLYLIYAMNIETGKNNIYQYDEDEKTIQRYIEHSNIDEKKLKDILYKTGIMVICIIISFIIIVIRNTMKSSN